MKKLAAFLSALILAAPTFAQAAGLIRDAEIESALRAYTNPILVSADIPPEDVRILIVNDPTLNAFVAGGLNIFVHTGLIRAADKPGMLIGVIAHETGHIAGAHLSQMAEKSSRSTLGAIIGSVIGIAAAIGGAGQAGGAILAGSQSMSQRMFIGSIRMNEQQADQAALRFLDDNDISASGMLEMFQSLQRNELGRNVQTDPFLRTHPLTSERIAVMRNHIKESTIPADQVPSNFAAMHARVLAKLAGFSDSYDQVLVKYPLTDTSVAGRYARAIAEFQRSNLPAALAGINELIKEYPNDPFFYDTKGQILFENGKLNEAFKTYDEAARLKPDSPLILTDYARCLTAQETRPDLLPRAIELLEKSKELDDSYSTTWRELAVAYGRQGRLGPSYLALAEEAALGGDWKTVLQHTSRARQYTNDDPGLALKIDDLERDAKAQLKQSKKNDLF